MKFWEHVDKRGPLAVHAVTGRRIGRCWMWTAAKMKCGYGRTQIGSRSDGTRRKVLAHRYAYELLVGPIEKPQLDHLCRNRACVNPRHLEPVTNAENAARGEQGAHLRVRTHCPSGHAYDETNTRHVAGNRRQCRACAREATRRWKKKRGNMATWIECKQKRADFKIEEMSDGKLSATWTSPRGVGIVVLAVNDHPDARLALVHKCAVIIAREDEAQAAREARAASATMQRKPLTSTTKKAKRSRARLVTR